VTLLRPYVQQAAGADTPFQYSAADFRTHMQGLWHQEGIIAPDVVFGALKVVQRAAGANFSVDVAAGRCSVFGDDAANQGIYLCESTAVENRVVPSPPGAGSRTHRVVARVRDKAHNASWPDGTYDWVLEVLEDTGLGTPALPPSAISLARVSVSAGQASVTNANIIDDRLSGALITSKFPLVGSDAGRPPNGYDSELIWRTDKGAYEVCLTGAWHEIPRRDGGGSAWTTYTPALTATTTNPGLGTSFAREGAYYRIGSLVIARGTIRAGTSGATAGNGIYMVSLPVPAKTLSVGNHMGSAETFDSSANNVKDGVCRIRSATGWNKIEMITEDTLWAHDGASPWANNDSVSWTIAYEAA
jgi:hypothetical protein